MADFIAGALGGGLSDPIQAEELKEYLNKHFQIKLTEEFSYGLEAPISVDEVNSAIKDSPSVVQENANNLGYLNGVVDRKVRSVKKEEREIAGACGVMVGYPLDTVKVRIQTQRNYNGIWHCIYSTYKVERMSGFFKGMSMPISTVSVSSSIVFGVYRNCLYQLCKLRYGTKNAKPSKFDIFLSGYAAGAVQVLVSSPADMAKVRLQTQVFPHHSNACSLVAGPKYTGPIHCILTIVREKGFFGLYKGCSALMFRDCHSFATYFLSYAIFREWFVPVEQGNKKLLGVLLSGGCAGVVAWGIATPMDVIKSRLQVDGVIQQKYRGVIHCITESVRQEGITVLFKGLSLNCLRAFPVNMVVFLTYEAILKQIKPFTS
ncbi:solute carrier family 25 member 47 [Pelodytes ibericus]